MYYTYKVRSWNEINREEEDETGIVFGENYSDAVSRIVEYFGENNAINILITALADTSIVCVPERFIKEIEENQVW